MNDVDLLVVDVQNDVVDHPATPARETVVPTQCSVSMPSSTVAHGFDVVLGADGHTTWDNDLLAGAAAVAYQNMLLEGFGTPDHEVAVVPGAEIRF